MNKEPVVLGTLGAESRSMGQAGWVSPADPGARAAASAGFHGKAALLWVTPLLSPSSTKSPLHLTEQMFCGRVNYQCSSQPGSVKAEMDPTPKDASVKIVCPSAMWAGMPVPRQRWNQLLGHTVHFQDDPKRPRKSAKITHDLPLGCTENIGRIRTQAKK